MSVTSVAEPMTDIDLDRLSIEQASKFGFEPDHVATCAKELLGKQ
jgi:hypothetical protein